MLFRSALWWESFPEEAREFSRFKGWEYSPELSFERRQELLYDSHHSKSLFHINLLQEYLALYGEMVGENLEDERINTPGTISENNWSYRFKPSVEELLDSKALQETIKEIIK